MTLGPAELPGAAWTSRLRGAGGRRPGLLAATVAVPLCLALARLLPAEGIGLALRLALAAALVLLLPGALLVAALAWRDSVGVAVGGAFVLSLVVVFAAYALAFAVGASPAVALGVFLAGLALAALAVRVRAPERASMAPGDQPAALALVAAGAALAAAVWWSTGTIGGSLGPGVSDALFHLARVRKLVELDALTSVHAVGELGDGTVHPGYAFPLWHGALALVARLAGVDAELVMLYIPAVLTPVAVLAAYGAGAALFRSWAGGVAAAAAQLALVAFPRGGIGFLEFLAQPGGVSRLVLVPALVALVFAFISSGHVALLPGLAAAGFALAVVHPTYVFFAALPLAGFALARVVLTRDARADALRAGLALVTALVPAGLFVAWLAQFVHDPAQASGVERYSGQVVESDWGLSLRPGQLAWGGGAKVAALLAVPVAALAAGRRWSAYVLGGTLVVLALALVPPLFERFADSVSLSQAVRLGPFLPVPFALAGAALLAARARAAAVPLALVGGVGLLLAYPDAATRAGWAVWTATGAAVIALVGAALARPRLAERTDGLAAAVAAAFVLPFAVDGLLSLERFDEPDPAALTPGLVAALRSEADERDTVLGASAVSYRVAAYAPVTIVIAPPGHFAFKQANRYDERRRDVERFFAAGMAAPGWRERTAARHGAEWVVVDKAREAPALGPGFEAVYEDGRYALFRVVGEEEGA